MTPPTQALARPAAPRLSRDDPAHSSRRTPAGRPPANDQPAGSRVLVLDGDSERQWLLSDAVVRAGGDAVAAGSGAEALALLGATGADLPALLVGGLPDGSRRGFIAWARPRFPELAIVSVADDAGEATGLYNAGADIVTSPPLDPDLLGAKLGAALRRNRRPQPAG